MAGLASKRASLGGSGGETEFEQAFSGLAFAYLRDKAPRLLDYLLGFQLIDRNEDNTKAVGIFAFQLGKQLLYAPVFFLNGDLKGHELLYVKSTDSFVPLQEDWINYLMSRKPFTLGESSSQSTFELGGLSPNIRSLSMRPTTSGGGKMAADKWLLPCLPLLAAFKTKEAASLYPRMGIPAGRKLNLRQIADSPETAALSKVAQNLDLNKVIPENFAFLKCAWDISQAYPGVKSGFYRFYGRDCFARWGRELKTKTASAASNLFDVEKPPRGEGSLLLPFTPAEPVDYQKSGELRMYVYEEVFPSYHEDLSDDDREKLKKDTVLIKDKRPGQDVSVVFNTQVEAKLANPSETDLYRVLLREGEFGKMLVLMSPYTNAGAEQICTVIDVEGGSPRSWLNTFPDVVFADQIAEKTEWDTWFEGLSDASSLRKGGTYVGISPTGGSIAPFKVTDVDDDRYTVSFDTWAESNGSNRKKPVSLSEHSTYNAGMRVHSNPRGGTKIRPLNGELQVPADVKFLQLSPPEEITDTFSILPCSCSGSGSKTKPIQLGKIEDIYMLCQEKTARLKVVGNSTEMHISSPKGQERLSKKAALLSLVGTHGLREDVARHILQQTEKTGGVVYRILYAPTYSQTKAAAPNESVLRGGPAAPMYLDQLGPQGTETFGNRTSVPAQYGSEMEYNIPGMSSSLTDMNVWDPWQNYKAEDFQKSVSMTQQAAQSGQKEVFDTAAIAGMLKSVRQDSLVEKYLGSLMEALDSLGRLLMNFYWHGEDFEDRYGQSDMPELEDALRNAFESLGDISLFLKEKTVESPFGTDDVDLVDSARN